MVALVLLWKGFIPAKNTAKYRLEILLSRNSGPPGTTVMMWEHKRICKGKEGRYMEMGSGLTFVGYVIESPYLHESIEEECHKENHCKRFAESKTSDLIPTTHPSREGIHS